jgi:hypothetical protein
MADEVSTGAGRGEGAVVETKEVSPSPGVAKFDSFVYNLKSEEIWIICNIPNFADHFF